MRARCPRAPKLRPSACAFDCNIGESESVKDVRSMMSEALSAHSMYSACWTPAGKKKRVRCGRVISKAVVLSWINFFKIIYIYTLYIYIYIYQYVSLYHHNVKGVCPETSLQQRCLHNLPLPGYCSCLERCTNTSPVQQRCSTHEIHAPRCVSAQARAHERCVDVRQGST